MDDKKNGKLSIEYDGNRARIYINDIPVSGVRKYSITHEAGGRPVVTMEIAPLELYVDKVPYIPKLPEYMELFYKRVTEFEEPPAEFLQAFGNSYRTDPGGHSSP